MCEATAGFRDTTRSNCRSLEQSIFAIPLTSSRFLALSVRTAVAVHVAALHPGLQRILPFPPLSADSRRRCSCSEPSASPAVSSTSGSLVARAMEWTDVSAPRIARAATEGLHPPDPS